MACKAWLWLGVAIEMASIVFGGRDSIEHTPAVISLINVNSPLRYDDRMLGALLEYSEARQPVIVTPGVRPAGSEAHDQARVATPEEALLAGADLLVIGRPITRAPDPGAAAAAIAASLRRVEVAR